MHSYRKYVTSAEAAAPRRRRSSGASTDTHSTAFAATSGLFCTVLSGLIAIRCLQCSLVDGASTLGRPAAYLTTPRLARRRTFDEFGPAAGTPQRAPWSTLRHDRTVRSAASFIRRGQLDRASSAYLYTLTAAAQAGQREAATDMCLRLALLEHRRLDVKSARRAFVVGHTLSPSNARLLVSWALFEWRTCGNRTKAIQLLLRAAYLDRSARPVLRWAMFQDGLRKELQRASYIGSCCEDCAGRRGCLHSHALRCCEECEEEAARHFDELQEGQVAGAPLRLPA